MGFGLTLDWLHVPYVLGAGKVLYVKNRSLVISAIGIVFVAGILLFAAACEGEPTPTPTPEPTATPTHTPTPTPPTVTPTPVPIDINELALTDTTTVGELLAAFSPDEVDCIRSTIGSEAVDMMYNVPFQSLQGEVSGFPIHCLSTENSIGLTVAFMSSEAGGLSTETRSCITDIGIANPSILGMGPPPENPAALFAGAIQMQLCLTDEEAEAFAAMQGTELPSPSALRCLEEQFGGQEAFMASLTDPEAGEEAILGIFAAAMACGEVIQPEGTPTG